MIHLISYPELCKITISAPAGASFSSSSPICSCMRKDVSHNSAPILSIMNKNYMMLCPLSATMKKAVMSGAIINEFHPHIFILEPPHFHIFLATYYARIFLTHSAPVPSDSDLVRPAGYTFMIVFYYTTQFYIFLHHIMDNGPHCGVVSL